MGPIEASLPRIAEHYRWQLLLKSENTRALHEFMGTLLTEHPTHLSNRSVKTVIDVDPYFIM
jgi:primosomal protein N' (replication factor Y)